MKKVVKFISLCFGILMLSGIGGGVVLYMWGTRDLPGFTRIADYRPALTTTVLARDGSVLGYFYRENRFLVSLNDLPKHLPQAFLAAEDASFYQHEGVDPVAIFRAFLVNLRSGANTQGGSTITQQIIKRLLLTPERNYERKIKEAILAYRLERYLSKDEILTIYLNQTFLGANAYGVEAAARTYFGKHARELTIAESALLAGLPKAPSTNNPYRNIEGATVRQRYVLEQMRKHDWITEEDYQAALTQRIVLRSMPEGMGKEGAWYLEEVRRQLIALFEEGNAKRLGLELPLYGEEAVYELGLTVQTAIEPSMQIMANQALREGLERFGRRQGWRGPIEKIPPPQIAERARRLDFEPSQLAKNGWVKAIVSEVTDKKATVQLGAYTGVIVPKDMGWMRVEGAKGTAYPVAIKDPRKALAVGDMIWVSAARPAARAPAYDAAAIKPATPISLALQDTPEVQGALVSIEPQTGDVVAMIGGYSFQDSQFNRATQAYRQPGSSFKPVVYSAALDNGFTAATVVLDAPVVEFMESGDVWRPSNYEKGFKGPMLLRTALALSRNLCTIRVAQQIGIPAVISRAKDLEMEPTFPEVLSVSLGAVAITPLNMTQAYTAFANGGILSKARFITSIKNFWGEPVYDPQPDLRDALSPQNAYVMASMLKDVINAGTGGKAKVLGRPLGGKTGTSNSENDAWFVGFTPYLVTGVYVGYDQMKPMGREGSGSSAALPIFVDYAKMALETYPPDDFPVPEGITFVDVDAYSGYLANSGSERTLRLPFYTGTEPGQGNAEESASEDETRRGEDLLKQLF